MIVISEEFPSEIAQECRTILLALQQVAGVDLVIKVVPGKYCVQFQARDSYTIRIDKKEAYLETVLTKAMKSIMRKKFGTSKYFSVRLKDLDSTLAAYRRFS